MGTTLKVNGSVFVLSGPSGAGKSTVCKGVIADMDNIHFSVSCTTRNPRPGEVDGVDYNFINKEEFEQKISEAAFLEYAEVHGNYYGTLKKEVEDNILKGCNVILDIDVQGARIIRDNATGQIAKSLCTIFFAPPDLETLEKRLRGRGTEEEEVVLRRLNNAKAEMQAWNEYDFMVINDALEDAVRDLAAVMHAAGQRTSVIEFI